MQLKIILDLTAAILISQNIEMPASQLQVNRKIQENENQHIY